MRMAEVMAKGVGVLLVLVLVLVLVGLTGRLQMSC